MSILVTGGTGFLGAQVARLLAENDELVLFDINPTTRLIDDLVNRVVVVRGDLGNFSHVLNAVRAYRPRTIFHLGGVLSVASDNDPPAAFRANAEGTFRVLESARLFDVGQVIFASTIGTYGTDLEEGAPIDDLSLQRPQLFYGVTKVFGELTGQFYRRKYDIDFRSVRFPAVIGPGQNTPSVVQYTSSMITNSFRGKPSVVNVLPETRAPVMYYKDAARALVELANTPRDKIRMINYLVAGAKPAASAADLADAVKKRLPKAEIAFKPDVELQRLLDSTLHPVDDHIAQDEWGWKPHYDLERMIDDFLAEMQANPQRYVLPLER